MARTVKFGANDMHLVGNEIQAGAQAPDFTVVANDLSEVKLSAIPGVRLIHASPSLDTGICDASARRFNQEAAAVPGVTIMHITGDLPFAQKRFCATAGIEAVKALSDYRYFSFGEAFGVLIKENHLLARSTFVVDSTGKVVYAEVLENSTQPHPNYEAALAAAKAAK